MMPTAAVCFSHWRNFAEQKKVQKKYMNGLRFHFQTGCASTYQETPRGGWLPQSRQRLSFMQRQCKDASRRTGFVFRVHLVKNSRSVPWEICDRHRFEVPHITTLAWAYGQCTDIHPFLFWDSSGLWSSVLLWMRNIRLCLNRLCEVSHAAIFSI